MLQVSSWRRPVSAKALVSVGLIAGLGGLVIGGLAYFVDRFVYVAVLFPLAMAYAGTILIDWAVTRSRMRNPLIAGIFGLLIGVLIFGTYNYCRYLDFRGELHSYIAYYYQDELESLDFDEQERVIASAIERLLQEETGATDFLGYLKYTTGGVRLGWWFGSEKIFAPDFGPRFNALAVWTYRFIELLTVAGLVGVGATAASRPYCEQCEEWWGGPTHFCPGTRDRAQAIAQAEPSQSTPYAGLWPRVGALLIDVVLLIGACVILGSFLWGLVSLVIALFVGGAETAFGAGSDLCTVSFPVVIWLYFAGLESSSKQATLGKMALRLAVTDLNGGQLSFGRASVRFWAKILSALPLGIGFLMTLVGEKKQGLHDVIAGSVVVRTGG